MPVTINGKKYFRTAEVCRKVGISRNTLYRWSSEEGALGVQHRDFRGWRLFTQEQLDCLLEKTASISIIAIQGSRT